MSSVKTIFFFLLLGLVSFADGGWVSGGGELLKDSHNPWFLNNVSDVYYCIKIDDANFGASSRSIEENLDLAIKYWKAEFNFAITSDFKNFGKLKIASQNFIKTHCQDEKVDIRFQFGHLERDQKEYLRRPTDFAAVTVRTGYNTTNLKAKGFVYLSPAKGPLAYNQEGVIKDAWKKDNGNLLYLALVHELGHVFGLPHSGAMGALMSEGFVETMLSSIDIPDARKMEIPFFSLPKKIKTLCLQEPLLKIWTSFFELQNSEKCVRLEFEHKENNQLFGSTNFNIIAGATSNTLNRKVYEITLSLHRFNPVVANVIWLPMTQEVFQKNEYIEKVQGVLGVSLISISKKGIFSSVLSGAKRRISVKFEQGKQGIAIDGVDENGDFVTLL